MIMKKLAIAMMLSVSALATSAQVNYKVQTACHPQDEKHYDTERLRSSFMMEKALAVWCMKCSVHKRIASQVGTQFFLTVQRNSSVLDSPGFRSFV